MTYLDWAATSIPDAGIQQEALGKALLLFGNPSSAHGPGKAARAALEAARARLAGALGLRSGMVAFTGSGSEADGIALLSLLRGRHPGASRPPHLVTTSIEHAAVFEQAKVLASAGIDVTIVDPRRDGHVHPEDVAAAVRRETALVAVMAVNNETGAVQDLAAISSAVRAATRALGGRKEPRIHADAVQALGKVPLDLESRGVTSAAFSCHKIGGPKGSGAFWTASRIDPAHVGGGQEGGLRPGTEDLFSAEAWALAADRAVAGLADARRHALGLEKRLLEGLSAIAGSAPVPASRMPGDPAWSPFIVSACFPGLSGEVLARAMADEGLAISTGSACSAARGGKGRRVLEAMGMPAALALCAVRVSTGRSTTDADIDLFLEKAGSLYRRLKT